MSRRGSEMCGELRPAGVRRAGKINPRRTVKLSIKGDSAQCAVARRVDGSLEQAIDRGAGAGRRAPWYRLTRSREHGRHNRVVGYLERERLPFGATDEEPGFLIVVGVGGHGLGGPTGLLSEHVVNGRTSGIAAADQAERHEREYGSADSRWRHATGAPNGAPTPTQRGRPIVGGCSWIPTIR